jgi:hypothetical protein
LVAVKLLTLLARDAVLMPVDVGVVRHID